MSFLSSLPVVGQAAGLIEGGVQFFDSLHKEKEDEKALQNLRQPFYNIQSEFYQNRNIASELASGGLPAQQKDYLTGQAERGLGSSLDAILRSGGGINDASIALDQYNQNIGKIGAEDASQHLNNIQYFMKANSDLAGEKTKQWSINEYQPYEAKLKELKDKIATDQQNKWGGINTAVGSVIGAGTSFQNADLTKRLFGNNKTGQLQDPYFTPVDRVTGIGGTASSPSAGYSSVSAQPTFGGVQYNDVSDNS